MKLCHQFEIVTISSGLILWILNHTLYVQTPIYQPPESMRDKPNYGVAKIEVINFQDFLVPPVDKNTYYITIDTGNGQSLTDLMFNYASLLGVAERNKMIPLLKIKSQEMELLAVFNITMASCSEDYFTPGNDSLENVRNHSQKSPLIYDTKTEALPKHHTQLVGPYISKNYYLVEKTLLKLKKEFTFKSKYLDMAKTFMDELKLRWAQRLMINTSNIVIVGINVNRGSNASLDSHGYTPPGVKYYTNAMMAMKVVVHEKYADDKVIIYVISSNNIPWCKEFLMFDDKNMDFIDDVSSILDLAILSLCDHIIISGGSHGWWAAWLIDELTVYYKDWPRPESIFEQTFKSSDYYYQQWIPMR